MSGRGFKGLGLAAALFMMGCTMGNQKNEQNSLRMHFPAVKLILDPHKMEDAFSMAVVTQLYRGLMRFNPKGDVVADLADSWKESNDHLRYSFHLKNATFSDGSPITARNVQMSFARIFASGASMGADLDYFAGVAAFKTSRNLSDLGIRVIADQDMEFTLSHPSVLFLKHLAVADSSILPITDFNVALDTSAQGAFSGPYRVKRVTEAELDIEKWRVDALDSPKPPKRVTFSMTERSPVEMARAGDTDSLDRDPLSASEQNELRAKGWTAHPTALMREEFIILNPNQVPAATRQYLFSKFDSEVMLKTLGLSNFQPAFGLIPTGLLGELPKKDLAALKSVSQQKSKEPEPGALALEFDEGNPLETRIAEYLKQLWSTTRFIVQPTPLPKRDRLKRMFGKLSQASLGGKQLDYPDGYSVLTYFKGGIDSNYFHVEDPRIDRELTELVSLSDPSVREAHYRKVQLAALAHYTVIPVLFGSDSSGLWSSRVTNVPPHPAGYHTLALETVEMR